MSSGRLLRLEEVAHKLGVSYTQIRMMVLYEGRIPYVTVGARGTRIKEEELEKYIASLEKKEEQRETVASESEDAAPKEPYEGRKILQKDSSALG